MNRVKSLAEERNRLVHSWWYPGKDPETAVRYKVTIGSKGLPFAYAEVTVNQVEQLASEMVEVADQLNGLGNELYPQYL